MIGRMLPVLLTCLAAYAASCKAAEEKSPSLYRYEKQVSAHACRGEATKLAAEAYFVGLLAVRHVGDEQKIEEYMTGGLLSDLGEELPPRPPADPIRRAYTLEKNGDVTQPLARGSGLVVWSLPFEFLLMPRPSAAAALEARSGVRLFSSHASKPALTGSWSWRAAPDAEPHRGSRIAGPCEGKFDGGSTLAGSLARLVDSTTGKIREAQAEIGITVPVAVRLEVLTDAQRKTEESEFFKGFDTIVIRESARMHADDDSSGRAIELPGSLSTAHAKLRQQLTAP